MSTKMFCSLSVDSLKQRLSLTQEITRMTKSEPPSTLKGTSKDHPSDHPKSLSKVNFTQNILSLMRS